MKQVPKELLQNLPATRNDGGRRAVLTDCIVFAPFLAFLFLVIIRSGSPIPEPFFLQNRVGEGAHFSALPYNQGAVCDASVLSALEQRIENNCPQERSVPAAASFYIDRIEREFLFEVSPGSSVFDQGPLITISYTRNTEVPGYRNYAVFSDRFCDKFGCWKEVLPNLQLGRLG
jgi:hypothetical protein